MAMQCQWIMRCTVKCCLCGQHGNVTCERDDANDDAAHGSSIATECLSALANVGWKDGMCPQCVAKRDATPPYPEGCSRFRMQVNRLEYRVHHDGCFMRVANIEDKEYRNACANEAIAWFAQHLVGNGSICECAVSIGKWLAWRDSK